jgi:hypothetical protein
MTIWGWALLGAGSWALAVALKVTADVVVQRTTQVALKDWIASLLSGVWSSLCELGLAAFAFWYWSATFADALVLATGAALAEFIVLLPAAISANWNKKQSQKKEAAGWSAFYSERAVAIANHLASRGLMWLGIAGPVGLAAAGSAVGLFALTEGVQAYGQAKEWDFLNRRIFISVLLFQAVIVGAQIVLFVMWSRQAP